jgi:Trk-type K+ transport system membrane component
MATARMILQSDFVKRYCTVPLQQVAVRNCTSCRCGLRLNAYSMFAILVVKLSASTTTGLSRGVTPTLPGNAW